MNLSPLPVQKFFDSNGQPLAGGQLFTYVAGSSTKLATYVDSTGVTPNTNPILLDFRGECRLWIDPSLAYKFVLAPRGDTDPPGDPIWSVDNISLSSVGANDNAGIDTGSGNSIQLTLPALTGTPSILTRIIWKSNLTNTGAVTITVNGGIPKSLMWQSGIDLAPRSVVVGGMYEAIYDGVQWQLQGPTLLPGDVQLYGAVGNGVINDTAAFQSAENASKIAARQAATFVVVPTGASPFNFANTVLPVYRAITIDRSNLVVDAWGSILHGVGRPGAAALDIQPMLCSDKNLTVGQIDNFSVRGLTVDLENDAQVNTNQRGYYLTGFKNLSLIGTTCKSSGVKRGYFAHIQNSRNIQALGNRTQNISGGLNFHYVENVSVTGQISDGFNEAFDFQTYANRVAMSSLVFNGGHGAAQCMDVNGSEDWVATGIVAKTTGNFLRVNFFPTISTTFANFLANITATNTTPTSRVIVANAAGSNVGDLATADNIAQIGNDWSVQPHPGVEPVTDIINSGWLFKDCTMYVVAEARRLVMRDIHLTTVTSAATFFGVDLRSQFSNDNELTSSDLDVHIDNLTINGSNRGGLRIDGARKAVILGVRTRSIDSLATGDEDLKITNMARRGTDAMVDYCDIKRDVAISGDSTVIATWAGTTAYVVNKMIKNGSTFYRCITAGTSAGAGGPTGTSADITDGSVHWEYCAEPFRVTWGKNNKVGGQVLFSGDSHNYVHGDTKIITIGDLAATGSTTRPMFHATRRCYIPRASLVVSANLAANVTNFRSFTIRSQRAGVSTTIQAITTAANNLTALVPLSIGFAAFETAAYLEPGDVIFFESASSAAGVAVTGLVVSFEVIEY